ncbi:hypothetical protein MKW94_012657 [Papaver nudicaule]|uniref:F-box domain-containing protein n=1 Tax=Papaver nudicaule TaxID=74823 RepID=A0AA41RZV0_PAPNU|nr:hypothetical protein [Papaver nudicaule]
MEIIPGLPNEIGRECLIRVPYTQFSKLMSVSKKWKQEIESNKFHQERKLRGFTQNLIALIQSDSIIDDLIQNPENPSTPVPRLSFYDPTKNAWIKLPPIPGTSSEGLPLFCEFAGVGRKLVVIGGWDTKTWQVLNSVYIYDLVAGTWRRGADMPGGKRSFFACASDMNRKVYVAGGHDDDKNALTSAQAYDVLDDLWIPLPDMARQRDECKGLYHGGKFHVIGGYQTETQGKFDKSTETFNIDTWKWDAVEEEKLESGICPRTCVFDFKGALYKCCSSYLMRLDGSKWRQFVELPADVYIGAHVVAWQKKMLVIGSDVLGGVQSCYVLEFENNEKRPKWMKLELSKECTRILQSGYSFEV